MYYNYNAKTLSGWMKDNTRPTKLTRKNLDYLRDAKEINQEFKRVSIIIHTLVVHFEMKELSAMYGSVEKQRGFVRALIVNLKEYGVESKWEAVFDRNLKSLHERVSYLFRILRDNIKLTSLYPYLSAVGFDRLVDFSMNYPADSNACVEQLMREVREYNSTHADEIERHMESVQEEIDNRDRHRKRIAEGIGLEKEAKRLEKKLARQEEKEIRENAKRDQRRRRKLEKEMEHYYK